MELLHKSKRYGYADIHSHMLPGVDDGSVDMDMTMKMLDMAYQEGTRRIFLTPHYGRNIVYQPQDLDLIYQRVYDRSLRIHPDLELYLGNEIFWNSMICSQLQTGNIHTMNRTRYVLVEFDISILRREILHASEELMETGFWPVIAHVERYGDLMSHPEDIRELVHRGAYLQMNTHSVVGKRFHFLTRKCHDLLEEGLIAFLGSDAHDTSRRAPDYAKAADWLIRHTDYAEDILWNNSEYLISGRSL